MKKKLNVFEKELISIDGNRVPSEWEGDEKDLVSNVLLNVLFEVFKHSTDLMSIDAACRNDLQINLHWRNGASTMLNVYEDDSKTSH